MFRQRSQCMRTTCISGSKEKCTRPSTLSAMDKGHVPARASQAFAIITWDSRCFGSAESRNDTHNLGVDNEILLHLLQIFPRRKGVLSRYSPQALSLGSNGAVS